MYKKKNDWTYKCTTCRQTFYNLDAAQEHAAIKHQGQRVKFKDNLTIWG